MSGSILGDELEEIVEGLLIAAVRQMLGDWRDGRPLAGDVQRAADDVLRYSDAFRSGRWGSPMRLRDRARLEMFPSPFSNVRLPVS